MNSQLAIIAVVDVDAALERNSLDGCINFVDNNRINGSTGQGSGLLTTVVKGQQILNWLVFAVDIYNGKFAYLLDVQGDAVDQGVIVPQIFESPEFGSRGLWWGANIGSNTAGTYSYELVVSVNGTPMKAPAQIELIPAFSNYETNSTSFTKKTFGIKDMKAIRSTTL